jgi:hypothetical protein
MALDFSDKLLYELFLSGSGREANGGKEKMLPGEVAMKAKRAKKDTGSSAPKSPLVKKTMRTEKPKSETQTAPKGKNAHSAATDAPKRKDPIVFRKEPHKGTFNTHDIMHSPVEKTIRMLEKIIAGERLFTM